MGEVRFDQSNFSEGELDPRLQARIDYIGYAKGAKYIRNNIVIPQGGVQRRWGTTYVATLATATAAKYAEISTLLYDDDAIYLLVWEALTLKIYLENILVATVVTTYAKEDIADLRFTQVENRLIVCNENFQTRQVTRSANAANAITGVDTTNDYITLTNALTAGTVYPAKFTTGGSLPVCSPQIYIDRTYFIRAITATSVRVYNNATDAINNVNYFDITNTGTGNVLVQNTWAIANITFRFTPAYDFTGGYNALTFTPSAVTGAAVTITASGAIFTAAMVGGYYSGNGGVLRIVTFTDTTHVIGYTVEDFAATTAIRGDLSFLGEPAWSATRGWPRCAAFFQNRLVFGGSASISNGVWLSAINDVFNFDDSQTLDDDAIAWYPSAGLISYIRSLTSARSLLVHANTGNFATPLTSETPITPKNFTLTVQNTSGVSKVQPIFIDNQIIYIDKSGNNLRAMSWEIAQSSYMDTSISITSSALIETPIDMAPFEEPTYTDGAYALIVNEDGTLAVWQTLYTEDIHAWSLSNTEQNATAGYFRKVTSGLNRAWFLVERTINSSTVFYIEELDFTVYTDCSKKYTANASAVLTGLAYLNGQTIQVVADGSVQTEPTVSGGQVTLAQTVTTATAGLSFESKLVPLPINIQTREGNNFYQSKHIRELYIKYYQTIGGTIQGYQLARINLQDVVLGDTPEPQDGVFQYTLMEGWDGFDFDIEIIQDQPLPMTILGLGYILESS